MRISIVQKTKYQYFIIDFEYQSEIVDVVRKIPSAQFNAKHKYWTAKVGISTAPKVYQLVKEFDFDIEQSALDLIIALVTEKHSLRRKSDAEDSDINLPPLPDGLELYPFQKAGVDYMVQAKRCFNGCDMGLGKSMMALVAMEKVECYPHFIICPAKMKKKWLREARKWLPHRDSVILNGDHVSFEHEIMILNYERILKYLVREIPRFDKKHDYRVREAVKLLGIQGVTFDESHKVKNAKSKRTKAARALVKGVPYRWLLSGTIIENRPKELISQLQILRRLNDFGGWSVFINTFCDAKIGFGGHIDRDGSSNLLLMNKKLRETCMFRLLKKDVLSELPDKTRIEVPVDISNTEEYKLAETDYFEWRRRYQEKKKEGLFAEDEFPESMFSEAIELQIINALKIVTAKGKLEIAKRFIHRFMDKKEGKKLVVYANHIVIQQGILQEFPEAARILGGMSAEEADTNEHRFQNDPDCRLIICSMKAAGEGIDLFAAHYGLFVELAWKPSTHDQCEDREWRLGQHHDVTWYYLLGNNTIDNDIYELLEKKRIVTDKALNGDDIKGDDSILNELVKRLKDKGKINIPEGAE